ncbi:MAG: hypothetical protein AABX88_02675 [Nanoarchaeota archaeon]
MLEEKINSYKQIPKKELIKNRWYLGRGRNSNVGKWDGKYFQTISIKFDNPVIKFEGYYEKKDGCFQPFLLIGEGEMIKPFGKNGWDKHYGKKLSVKLEE